MLLYARSLLLQEISLAVVIRGYFLVVVHGLLTAVASLCDALALGHMGTVGGTGA